MKIKCPNCEVEFEQEISEEKKKSSGKGLFIVSAILLFLALIFAISGVVSYLKCREIENARIEAEQQAQLEEKKIKQTEKKYEDNLKKVVDLMFDGAIEAEDCGNLIQSVWHNNIYEIEDAETDKYTKDSTGKFFDDFNDSLSQLYSEKEFATQIDNLETNQYEVEQSIRELKNPPEKWRDAYEDLLKYYDVYYDFTELMIRPNCSLQEFKELFEESDTEVLKVYRKMYIYIE